MYRKPVVAAPLGTAFRPALSGLALAEVLVDAILEGWKATALADLFTTFGCLRQTARQRPVASGIRLEVFRDSMDVVERNQDVE